MTSLFDPITLRGLTIPNRIWLPPMCQYMVTAADGVPTDWHLVHHGARAVGGFGLLIAEATAVAPEGRISAWDTGLWNEAQVLGWRRVTDFVHAQGRTMGVQLAHAGRKASTYPWRGDEPRTGTVPPAEGGWQTVGPTAEPFPGYAAPRALTDAEVREVPRLFAAAAARADAAGFDVVEVHAAHGYLLHQFLSPLVNTRTDAWGGSFENRTRLVVEVVDAVRATWPDHKPVMVRLSATDWAEGGWDADQTGRLGVLLRERGVDALDISTGGAVPARITQAPGYQVEFAHAARLASGLPTAAVGRITEPAQAQAILDAGHADAVLVGRAALREPSWPQRAASELGVPTEVVTPPQYFRAWAK